MSNHEAAERGSREGQGFGTFSGVMMPSLLTILGIILFLRAGYVVGQAGVTGSLLILGLAELIVLLTAISLAAVATNTPVKGGGAYFLISRTLGPAFGGSVGTALFVAQALSVPFYILGFTEILTSSMPGLEPYRLWISLGTAVVLFLINYAGAGSAVRAQYVILALLCGAIAVMLIGLGLRFDAGRFAANLPSAYSEPGLGFWTMFAIYFPAVTGIMTGINMSGELKDPGRALVRGTFGAIAVGFLVYVVEIVLFAGAADRADLQADAYGILKQNALLGAGFLVVAGVVSATLSSALGSLMTAPRVLQALARDRIFRVLLPFARTARNREPRTALWLTLLLTVIVLIPASRYNGGDAFNALATLLTMFFLATYGLLNLAAFVESLGSNPSFRPRFKMYHWSVALLGAVGCFGAMLLINWWAELIAAGIMVALYLTANRRVFRTAYGDARRGFVYASLARSLDRLHGLAPHPKNWRPTILALSGNPESRLSLVQYSVWMEAGRGIVSVVQILIGRLEELADRRKGALDALEGFLRKNDFKVFPEVLVTREFDVGLRHLLQAHSLGPIKPNLVMMGWPQEPSRYAPFVRHLRAIRLLGKSALVMHDQGVPVHDEQRRIDLWWRGNENGSLMLILAHLLTSNWAWRRSTVRLLRSVKREEAREPARQALQDLIEAGRINAEAEVVVSDHDFREDFVQASCDADLVLLGFEMPEQDQAETFCRRWEVLLRDMPTTILVNSSGEADLLA